MEHTRHRSPGSPTTNRALIEPDGTLIVSFDSTGSALVSGVTTVTNNGSAKVYPKIKITGPSSGTARILYIENITTGKRIWLDYTINAGETATLNLIPGSGSFTSDFRGNLWNTIRPGAQSKDFFLMKGDNSIGFYATNSTVTASVIWNERCWSIDSSGT
jgi:hypothetical protein